jgi:hypothetical protein
MTTIHPLPPIRVWINENQSFETIMKEKLDSLQHKAGRICGQYRILITICVMCVCVGSIAISIMMKNKNASNSPCYYYPDSTLASDVSEECITYLWNSAQCSTALQSNPTWKWWIQSPQGPTMIKCNGAYTGILCGAGNYNIIRTYLPLCNSRFGQ